MTNRKGENQATHLSPERAAADASCDDMSGLKYAVGLWTGLIGSEALMRLIYAWILASVPV